MVLARVLPTNNGKGDIRPSRGPGDISAKRDFGLCGADKRFNAAYYFFIYKESFNRLREQRAVIGGGEGRRHLRPRGSALLRFPDVPEHLDLPGIKRCQFLMRLANKAA